MADSGNGKAKKPSKAIQRYNKDVASGKRKPHSAGGKKKPKADDGYVHPF